MTRRPTYRASDFTRAHLTFGTQDPTETLILTETQAAARFHMPAYLMGTPERVYLMSTSEVCQTQYDASDARHAWFVKNGNSEEFGVYGGYVLRGTDTSPNEAEYYQQWATTGTLGAKWCPEWWDVGKPYLRECEVRYFWKHNGTPSRKWGVESTSLQIMAHHPTKGFPGGIAVQDVLELAWFVGGGPSVERYWYARGYGLVGFSNIHGFASHITQKEWTGAKPVRKHFTGVVNMVLPLEPEPEVNPIPEGYEEYILNTQDNMRIREPGLLGAANPQGRIVFLVPVGSRLFVQKSSLTKPDGQTLDWVRVIYNHIPAKGDPSVHRGWMGILNSFDEQFQPLPQHEPENPPPPKPDDEDTQENPAVKFATVEYVNQKIEDSTEYDAAKFEALTKRLFELETIVSKLVAAYGKGHLEAVELVKELPKSA